MKAPQSGNGALSSYALETDRPHLSDGSPSWTGKPLLGDGGGHSNHKMKAGCTGPPSGKKWDDQFWEGNRLRPQG